MSNHEVEPEGDGLFHEAETVEETEGFQMAVGVGIWAVPVIIVHLFLFSILLKAATGISFSWISGNVISFLWISGGLIGAAIHFVRKGHFPIMPQIRVRGWRAVYYALAIVLIPFAFFIAPSVLRTLWAWLIVALSWIV